MSFEKWPFYKMSTRIIDAYFSYDISDIGLGPGPLADP